MFVYTIKSERFIIKLLGNTKYSIKIQIFGCMFLILHHRQLFHESLIIYKILMRLCITFIFSKKELEGSQLLK